jgi:hypothetical protein
VNAATVAREAGSAEWRTVYPALKELELPAKLLTLGAWLWAAASVASRTVFVPFDAAGALCPVGDLFNYTPPPCSAEPEVNGRLLLPPLAAAAATLPAQAQTLVGRLPPPLPACLGAWLTSAGCGCGCEAKSEMVSGEGVWDESKREYQFWARAPYLKGQQVFMCYGLYTNLELMVRSTSVARTPNCGRVKLRVTGCLTGEFVGRC